MGRRRADRLPAEEAAAIEQFLRELKRDSPPNWMTGAPDAAQSFWSETDEDYGIGPTGPLGPPRPQMAEGR